MTVLSATAHTLERIETTSPVNINTARGIFISTIHKFACAIIIIIILIINKMYSKHLVECNSLSWQTSNMGHPYGWLYYRICHMTEAELYFQPKCLKLWIHLSPLHLNSFAMWVDRDICDMAFLLHTLAVTVHYFNSVLILCSFPAILSWNSRRSNTGRS